MLKTDTAPAGKECALCLASAKAGEQHKPHTHPGRVHAIPWIILLLIGGTAGLFLEGSDRWVSMGLCAGVGATIGLAWMTDRINSRLSDRALEETRSELMQEADERVAIVVRQFEWAVNDVNRLRDALNRTEDSNSTTSSNERRMRKRMRLLEAQLYDARMKMAEYAKAFGAAHAPVNDGEETTSEGELVVPLTWHLFDQNGLPWLRLDGNGIVPTQVRLLNEVGGVITISVPAGEAVENGHPVGLAVRAPDNVVATLEGRSNSRFKFEALVDDVWCAVELREPSAEAEENVDESNGWHEDVHAIPQALIA